MRSVARIFVSALVICLNIIVQRQTATPGPAKTVVKDQQAKQRLLGRHRLSLQWISWDYFGTAIVSEANGLLSIKGGQKARGTDDYLKVEGAFTLVDTKEIRFEGTIVTKVSHINGGEPCKREGEMTFRITGNRRYWRLKEMENPCDEATDYVDIFFR